MVTVLLVFIIALLALAALIVARAAVRRRRPLPPPAAEETKPLAQQATPGIGTGVARPQIVAPLDPTPTPQPQPDALPQPPPLIVAPEAKRASLLSTAKKPVVVPAPAIVLPWRTPRTRYPVVFAHGVLGFDHLQFGLLRQEYFRGVARHLQAIGVDVLLMRVSPVASIATRAEQLARQIQSLRADRVNIIAHSMGGLDARFAISRLGLADRVASLTTIGTPHHGTPLADSGLSLVADRLRLRWMLGAAGIHAFNDLTTVNMTAFNAEVPDASNVTYACYPASVRDGIRNMNVLLAPTYLVLSREIGCNDGIVPASSQRWGIVVREIDADHWAQVGWSNTFNALAFYAQIVRDLEARGL